MGLYNKLNCNYLSDTYIMSATEGQNWYTLQSASMAIGSGYESYDSFNLITTFSQREQRKTWDTLLVIYL